MAVDRHSPLAERGDAHMGLGGRLVQTEGVSESRRQLEHRLPSKVAVYTAAADPHRFPGLAELKPDAIFEKGKDLAKLRDQTRTDLKKVLTTEQLFGLQREVDRVFVDPVLMEYVVRIVSATRIPKEYGLADMGKYITYGASPRASINLVLTARALAYMRGRDYVLAQDIQDVALDVLRHRLVLSYEALSDETTSDALIAKVIERIPVPVAPMQGGRATARA